MSVNTPYLGDTIMVRLEHAYLDSKPWKGIIKAFANGMILVRAANPSDDPLVTNEWWIDYGEICQ
jgi:hypothetical protein